MITVDAKVTVEVTTKSGKTSSVELEYNDLYVKDSTIRFPKLKVGLEFLEYEEDYENN